jgi:hypothetical protein
VRGQSLNNLGNLSCQGVYFVCFAELEMTLCRRATTMFSVHLATRTTCWGKQTIFGCWAILTTFVRSITHHTTRFAHTIEALRWVRNFLLGVLNPPAPNYIYQQAKFCWKRQSKSQKEKFKNILDIVSTFQLQIHVRCHVQNEKI